MAESIGVEQGDVLWAVDPFRESTDTQRPLVVLSNDSHPFHDEQWITVALSTVPHPRAIEVTDGDWLAGTLPPAELRVPVGHPLPAGRICRLRRRKRDQGVRREGRHRAQKYLATPER